MISEAMTQPDHPATRRFQVLLVAVAAFTCQYASYRPNGALWALLCLAPLVPLWDFLWPGNLHNWHGNKPLQTTLAKSGKMLR
jgi:hypothetical protein